MSTFKIVLAYDGTDYVGWQLQASGVSIQGLLEDALRALDERDVRVTGAGRTDAGVHALGQVASFTIQRALTADAVVRAINARLPDAVRVLSAEPVADTFHPRFGATTKTYRYRIWNGEVVSPFERRYAWHVAGALDVDAMRAAARLVEGRRDFAAFQAAGGEAKTTVREILVSRIADCGLRIPDCGLRIADCGLRIPDCGFPAASSIINPPALRDPHSALLEYEIIGTGFLRHMVRTLVGTLVEVGRGRRPVEWISDVLASRDRTTAGPTAPPEGLFLVSVEYGESLAARS
jgi:tRNA pseudouridine38-40 synthase